MARQQEQEYEPVFEMDNKFVLQGWQKVNPKNKKPSVPIEKVEVFLKYVFEENKDDFQMELDQNTDYRQMVIDFLQENQLTDKNTFSFEDAVDILNWVVDPGDKEEEEEEQQEHQRQSQFNSQQKLENSEQKLVERSWDKPEQTQNQVTSTKEQKQESNLITPLAHHIHENHTQRKESIKEPKRSSIIQEQKKEQSAEKQIQTKSQDPHEKENPQNQKYACRYSYDEHDWGKVNKSEEEKHLQLYKEINSYQDRPHQNPRSSKAQLQQITHLRQLDFQPSQSAQEENLQPKNQKFFYRQPLSIKKSLAKLNKSQAQNESKNIIPVLKLDPTAPEMRYLKKHKFILKKKKAKPEYNPQKAGLQELFKFYCSINSEFYSISKHKDPAKGTFDELQSRITNLYMHNFMLLCKDFGIIETKMSSKVTVKNSCVVDHVKENIAEQNANSRVELQIKRRNSKGQVPESHGNQIYGNSKNSNLEIGQKIKVNLKVAKQSIKKKETWDRDKLSNYFKKEADYTLNLKFDKFIQIMKTVLKDKLIIEDTKSEEEKPGKREYVTQNSHQNQMKQLESDSRKQISKNSISQEKSETQQQNLIDLVSQSKQKQGQKLENEEQKQKYKKSPQIDPVVMALCKFFKVDTQKNYEQTFYKLKIQYKITEPLASPLPQKKQHKQFNGQFQQDIVEALKVRQLQKQKHRMEVKEKYLSKFSAPQIDAYSSFKTATNHANTLNSLYGSAPKIITNKSGKCSTVSEGTFGTAEYDMRKKYSGDYKINMGSIIKNARNEIFECNKENRQTPRLKEYSHTQNLAKSRFNPVKVSQNSPKPILGYKKLHDLRQLKDEEETLSSILLNNSRLMDGSKTNRSQKIKQKLKDINSPLLHRMGCHEDDDLLNKYFDQEKQLEKSNVKLGTYMR